MQTKSISTTHERPNFISVEFRLGSKTPENDEVYNLPVVDNQRHGLGILVNDENKTLLQAVKPGYKFQNMEFFAKWAILRVEGVVKHISRITGGIYEGSYFIGIQSQDII